MTNLVRRYPVASFYILTVALGAAIVQLVVQGVMPARLALAAALAASTAGIIMTAVADGRAGLRLMLSRLRIWRVKIGYWLFAILFLVPAILLGSMANPIFNGDPLDFSRLNRPLQIIPMFIAFFIVAGLGQELGWTGFLMTRLQARYSALTSSVIRAILVAVWHIPLLIHSASNPPSLADFQYSGWIAQKGLLLTSVVLVPLILLPWSIFLTWVFNNTRGSLLLVAVMHGSEVWIVYWMLNTGISPSNFDNYWGYGAIMLAVALIIVLANGAKDLSRKSSRIVHRPSER
jgi:membrane protease YdiL (CAAX protease family)